jgi:3-hydroxyisobutyrate dehydrogenase-like beta-hydroxyacid dehydrogenase
MQIGFIGLGNLGAPIAINLAKAGHSLKVYNRTTDKARPLADLGAEAVAAPHDVCSSGGTVITLVSDDAAIKSIINEDFLQRLGKGTHISMSTIGADTSRELTERHKRHGSTYVAAPIFARPEAAAAKVGTVCISGGTLELRNNLHGLLKDGAAKTIFDFGDDPGAANVVKLIGNFMIASTVELLAEVFALAEKNNVSKQTVYEIFTSTLFAAPVFQNYGRIILSEKFEPASFRLALGLKDVNLVLDNARQAQARLPLAELVKERMQKSIAEGNGDIDWAAFSQQAKKDAGL